MNKPLSVFIGWRYTRARKQDQFISYISLSSMLGIAIGVLVLITVMSVMNGFEQTMREKILGMLAHITVSKDDQRLSDWDTKGVALLEYPEVKEISPFVEKQIMLNQNDESKGVLLTGIFPKMEARVSIVDDHIVKGNFFDLKPGKFSIAIGETVAKDLQLAIGDEVLMLSPRVNMLENNTLPTIHKFTLVAIYKVDMQNYDAATAYIHIEDAIELFNMGTDITAIRLQLNDLYDAKIVAKKIKADTDGAYWIRDWTQQNANFFKAIQMQKTVMFFILILLVAVAVFNLVSTLVMVVTDKESDIAILRTLGLTPSGIMRIFMVQGTLIGIIGTTLGVSLGVLLSINVGNIIPFLENLFQVEFLSSDVYFISTLEGRLVIKDVIVIALSAFWMSILATIYPAWRASKIEPAESLRYE